MKELNAGKFEIELQGETRTVLVSLGLKAELYGLITKAQIELANLDSKVLLKPEFAESIKEKDVVVKTLEAQDPLDDEKLEAAKEELDAVYTEALLDLEVRQQAQLEQISLKKIALAKESFAKLVSCLLSERDDVGKVITKLPLEAILWNPVYAEAQEELIALVEAVVTYVTAALKKISEISQLVQGVNEAATP